MVADYLHNHKQFHDLINIVSEKMSIEPGLVEKDYWIMHILYGLKKQGFQFELKGGTSLSKGFGIIARFSEDIDIHISPPNELQVNETSSKTEAIKSRKVFYDWLNNKIKINGIIENHRDTDFDNLRTYTSGGIRLLYNSLSEPIEGVKEGILLEAGFDTVTPNELKTISSWAFDHATTSNINILDNRAIDISCYHPGYTFVEKLQTIATKFRKEQESGSAGVNFMRQYYDIYSLLENKQVLDFIGSEKYFKHKEKRFPNADKAISIAQNEAFLLNDQKIRTSFVERYQKTAALYYNGQPAFDKLIERIKKHIDQL
ncbi:nucleotidyl transferase AbiEii/AbiGii toxin family protein [Pedobacter flavus]|uniref:Nucleotidyl transferase AbiEii/AbiGii toxin family protein n=1 Tax=Pedobacter flavus TaxID=3113906 RepID=A0ABU7H2G3_9SPHI|nr:nucleotidyl transferase AbiEii/AbiGii toxin family protein [Pedobacter sp. VNH31]MEE1885499.1 nucleotidyl transferase AbiEii/AbiGii toxin family protein [Pedobacter sp. VNH31]